MKNEAAVSLGKKSAKARLAGKTKKERREFMQKVRNGEEVKHLQTNQQSNPQAIVQPLEDAV